MKDLFTDVYVVCLDFGEDINYVIGRKFRLEEANELAEKAKNNWPNIGIYITMEKILKRNPLESKNIANVAICICGKNAGACIGNLGCKCSAIATCKKVVEENPLDLDNYNYQPPLQLESTMVEIVDIKRGIIELIIPAWNPQEIVSLSINDIRNDLRKQIKPGVKLMADINLDANSVETLVLENLKLITEENLEDEDVLED